MFGRVHPLAKAEYLARRLDFDGRWEGLRRRRRRRRFDVLDYDYGNADHESMVIAIGSVFERYNVTPMSCGKNSDHWCSKCHGHDPLGCVDHSCCTGCIAPLDLEHHLLLPQEIGHVVSFHIWHEDCLLRHYLQPLWYFSVVSKFRDLISISFVRYIEQ